MRIAIALASAVALLLAVLVLFERDGPDDPSLTSVFELEREPEAPTVEMRRVASSDSSGAPLGEVGVLGAPRADGAAERGMASLRGRLLLPSGAPAIDVRLRLHATPDTSGAVEASSDVDGHFELRFVPPRASTLTLDARLARYARATWRWHELPRRAVTDLGTCTLATAGRLEGRLRDRDGRVPDGAWSVTAFAHLRSRGFGAAQASQSVRVDPATGVFVFDELSPGVNSLLAQSDLATRVENTYVEVPAGGTARVELVYQSLYARRAILVSTAWRSARYREGQLASVVLHGASDGPRRTEHDRHGVLRFEDLDPSLEYRLEIEDPRILPVNLRELRAGKSYRVDLEGSAAFRLRVRNAASGARLPRYRLSIRYRNVLYRDEIALRAIDRPEPADGLYRGIVPGDLTLVVEAEGCAPASIDIEALGTGETRDVELALGRGGSVTGFVLGADGTAFGAGIEVILRPGIRLAEGGDPYSVHSERRAAERETERCRRGVTDEQGRFAFEGLPPGRYELRAEAHAYASTQTFVEVEESDAASRVDLYMPPLCELVGLIRGAPPAELEAMRVRLKIVETDSRETDARETREATLRRMEALDADEPVARVDAEGRFRLAPIEVGTYCAELLLVTPAHANEVAFPWHKAVAILQLGEVVLEAGRATELVHDLDEKAPGYLRVQVLRAGRAVPAIHLMLSRAELIEQRNGDESLSGVVREQTDERGHARFGPLFAGEWQLTASCVDRTWSLHPPIDVLVASGKETTQRVEIELYEHELLLLDAPSGEPLAEREIRLEHGPRWKPTARTDVRGRLRIALPPGRFEVFAGERPPLPLEWSASGPSPRELRFAAAPESR